MAEAETKTEPKAAAKPKAKSEAKSGGAYVPRMKTDYDERIAKVMTEKFGYKNRMAIPRLDKIVINMGVGEVPKLGWELYVTILSVNFS